MEPTNSDLQEAFEKHAADDKLFQDAQGLVNEATAKSLASLHQRLGELATKDDIGDIKTFLKNISVGVGIFKFSWNNASKIGSFALLLISLYAIAKFGVFGAIQWFFSKAI